MHKCIGATAAAAAMWLAAGATASVIPDMSVGEVFKASKDVVHGKIVAQESRFEKTAGGDIIFTYSTVEVWSSAKGKAKGKMLVRTTGGSVDGYNQALIGEATVRPGEEVVLFLSTLERGKAPTVTGFFNGKFGVEIDIDGQVELVQTNGAQGRTGGERDLARFPMAHFVNELGAAAEPKGRRGVAEPVHDHQAYFRPTADLDSNPALKTFARSLTRGVANADVNADGEVNADDLAALSDSLGTENSEADVNADGIVDAADISEVIETISSIK